MRRPVRKTVNVLLAGTLAAGLGIGGAAAASLAPAGAPGGQGLVQVAQAKTASSKAKKAKHAYKKFLAGEKYKWGILVDDWYNSDTLNPKNYKFALGDIDGDHVPELFVENDAVPYSQGYSRVFQYRKGKVRLLQRFSIPPERIYTRAHVLYYRDQHTGSYWGRYFTMSKGKLKYRAGWSGTDMPRGKFHYDGYTVNGKNASKASYKKQLAKLLRKGKSYIKFSYHKNTSANRAKYL